MSALFTVCTLLWSWEGVATKMAPKYKEILEIQDFKYTAMLATKAVLNKC